MTIDQIFTLRQKGREYKMQTYHLFINFKNIYDGEELYKVLI